MTTKHGGTQVLLIKNGYMIDPRSGRQGEYDILIQGKKIVKNVKIAKIVK